MVETGNLPIYVPEDLRAGKLPTIFLPTPEATERFWDFFTSNIRNRNTRRVYYGAVTQFSAWCEQRGLFDLAQVKPVHVAGYIESMQATFAKPTIKLHLAAIRALFDWLVVRQVIPLNPAHSVRGPKYVVRRGKTPVMNREDARLLLNSIESDTLVGLRDRAIIATMIYTFCRVGALVQVLVADYFYQGRDRWMLLHEKGGREHPVLTTYRLDDYLDAYIEAAGIAQDTKGFLFRTSPGWKDALTDRPMNQAAVYRMIRARAAAADLRQKVSCHSCRATGITIYRRNGGSLEGASSRAGHANVRTTQLYDHSDQTETRAEVERIAI